MRHLEAEIKLEQAEIARKERLIADWQRKIDALQREIDSFKRDYERIVKPIAERLEATREAIAELEREQFYRNFASAPQLDEEEWEPPADYVPVEEQFRRTWYDPPPSKPASARLRPPADAEADPAALQLKQLYRLLARRYHPDLAVSEADRNYRNRLMALINEAYTAGETDVLVLLAEQGLDDPQAPLVALRLHSLRQQSRSLDERLSEQESAYSRLFHSEWMGLKMDVSLAQSRKRNLLRELAASLESEYQIALRRLDQLRRAT
jgi:hypothetical protein